MNVSKGFRHLHRYREIAVALARNGFGYVVGELGFPEAIPFLRNNERKDIHKKTVGERIRLMLEDLGPTFVKLGQIASTRPDLVPASVISELVQLQDRVPPFSYADAVRIVEEELGASIGELFMVFPETPIAAASIGQVYHAVLKDGTPAAVKVQRPHIQRIVDTDLDILAEFARVAENRLEWARNYRVRDMVEEISKAIRAELDYAAEARQAEKFQQQCRQLKDVLVPDVFWDYTTRRVLTMQYMEGISLSDRGRLERENIDKKALARQLADLIIHQILIEGFFHGDPHPGNIQVLPGGKLGLLDFGSVGKLSQDMRKQFAFFVISLRNQSTSGIIRAISSMGIIPDEVDMIQLRADVDEMREKYYATPLSRIRLGEAVNDLFTLAFRHHIRIPSEMTMLGKSLLTLEGVVVSLDPDLSVLEVAEPYGRKLFMERYDPRKLYKKAIEDLPEFLEAAVEFPSGMRSMLATIRKGKLRFEAGIPELGVFLKSMDKLTDKLALSLVLLSFSLLVVGLIIGAALAPAETVLWNLPILEISFVIAALLLLWLIISLWRSRKL
ncbi:AarF/ABC1/UbiB kinase family protein [Paenibacillus sp. YN15]|uniref:ABC1 kinase family protein n=1 Tax=Paenibacillus sp. YN15 TaxID=1742774 RepID=UPI000DCCB777|nr:AarF/ABC1/UbiB kinase family protein [Paenibacillus sp. YN15]RAV02327.1 ABC transporter [Paenibacillus sp. YN15]